MGEEVAMIIPSTSALFPVFRLYRDTVLISANRQADLFSIASATDIHGSQFDDPAHPVAPGGDLESSITPAKYVSFVNYVDSTQLARFGLHDGTGSVIPSCFLTSYILNRQAERPNPHRWKMGIIGTRTRERPLIP